MTVGNKDEQTAPGRMISTDRRADLPAKSRVLDRALGSFLGLAVGDALGATVEFMTAQEIAAQYRVHKQIIGGGWLGLTPGRVTDDTEMALALGSAVVSSGGWNLRAIADAFARWMRGQPVDIGNTCRRGIRHYLATGSLCVPPAQTLARADQWIHRGYGADGLRRLL
jgi:ADP-ribosyl-[dinitrogen reductase] hydrolase